MADYYAVLGVDRAASQADIKRAYRRLAQQHHPDKNSSGGDERFKAVNEAHAVLSSPVRRAEYDAMTSSGRYSDSAIADFFRSFVDASHRASPFGEAFTDEAPLTLNITPAEALSGTSRPVRWGNDLLQLQIPPNTAAGQVIDLSVPGGRLSARIEIELESPLFWHQRHAALDLTVALSQALSGAEVAFDGLDGKRARLLLRPGVQPGQMLRLPGRGLPIAGGGRDDLYVRVNIQLPKLNDEARQAFAAFARKYL